MDSGGDLREGQIRSIDMVRPADTSRDTLHLIRSLYWNLTTSSPYDDYLFWAYNPKYGWYAKYWLRAGEFQKTLGVTLDTEQCRVRLADAVYEALRNDPGRNVRQSFRDSTRLILMPVPQWSKLVEWVNAHRTARTGPPLR